MAAPKTPNKTSTPTKAKLAPANTPAEARAQAAAKASRSVSKAVEAPKPESVLEAAPVAKPEPAPEPTLEPAAAVAVEPTLEPEAVVPVAVGEPEVAPEPADAEIAAEIAIDEEVEQLASLAEQVIHEAEAIAGEAAHNFQVALKAATGTQGVVPTLNGINSYLHRSVRINSQFMEQFAGVRSPIELVQLQMHFLEEHRLAMVEFAQQWIAKKSAS